MSDTVEITENINDPAAIITKGLADLAALKAEVAEADSEVEQAQAYADDAIARVKEETAEVVKTAADKADDVRTRYAERINELVSTGWATPASLEMQGHAARRPRGRKKFK